jgi:drug/metabolite transporter (DMT)-like permease
VPASALALALSAAVVHATWNLLLAGARDPEAATAVALTSSAVLGAPLAAIWWHVDGAAWPFIAASSALELTYFALLGAAYRRAELSVVYPLARGLAPVLVLVAGIAVLGAATSAGQVVGVCLVGAGVLLVRGLRRAARAAGAGFGVAIACCIAAYTLVDKHGIAHASPLAYLELITASISVGYAGGLAALSGGTRLRAELNGRAVAAGAAAFGAYALVLAALRLAPAASVAAVRETSVVIATALAAIFLRERVSRGRLAGAVLVAGGIALLGL